MWVIQGIRSNSPYHPEFRGSLADCVSRLTTVIDSRGRLLTIRLYEGEELVWLDDAEDEAVDAI